MIEAEVALSIILLAYGWLSETDREPKRVKQWRKSAGGKRKGGSR